MSQINGVVYRKTDPTLTNDRPQRTLFGVYNGDQDLNGYKAEQVKLYQLHQSDYLGKKGHYHPYAELYYVMRGEVIFDLWDRETNNKERFTLTEGHLLLIPAGIVHRAYGKEGTFMFGSSSAAYTFDPPSETVADFEPVGETPYGLS
jgi:mannose-6-phosphate isomerase-like protein (cupin superfamily)